MIQEGNLGYFDGAIAAHYTDDFDGYEIDDGVIEFDWNPPDRFRAKLYNLDSEGRWHDLGTGNFSIELKHGHYKMKLIQEQNS